MTTDAVAVPAVDSTESADRHAFEAALEASFPASKRPQEGEAVSGIIAGITPDVVLVSIGAKSEALMDLHELEGEKVGDRIDAVVIKAGPDSVEHSHAQITGTPKRPWSAVEGEFEAAGAARS